MSDKPIGVFVRLPLSDAEKMALTSGVKMGGDIEAGISAIGTPVTGGELEVVGTIHIGDNGKPFFTAPEIYSTGGDVVRQSDALAKLAEKDAEIALHREALRMLLADWEDCMGDRPSIGSNAARKALKGPEV